MWAWLSPSFLHPILQLKSHYALELAGVVGDQDQVVRQGGRRDHQVVRPDGRACPFQLVADATIVRGTFIVEWQRAKRRKEFLEQAQILGDARC